MGATSRSVTLRVSGMSCMSCVKLVTSVLEEVDTVSDVHVSLDTGLALLKYSGDDVSLLCDTVTDESGKTATLVSIENPTPSNKARPVTLHVAGMTCMSCVKLVKSVLDELDTVSDVDVSLDTGHAVMKFSGSDEADLIDAVLNEAGKAATLVFPETSSPSEVESIQLENEDDGSTVRIDLDSPRYRHDISPEPQHDASREPLLESSSNLPVTRMRVNGMTCTACVKSVERALLAVDGVESAKINLIGGMASVTHNAELKTNILASAITNAGFSAQIFDTKHVDDSTKPMEILPAKFRIEFETETQAQNASKMLRTNEAVESVETKAYSMSCEIHLNKGHYKSSVLALLEKHGGYGKMQIKQTLGDEEEALLRDDMMGGATNAIQQEAHLWFRRFCLAVFFFIPILVTSWAQNAGMMSFRSLQWTHFFLATPVQFISGAGFYRASYYALKKKRATMDVLVSLSTSIAYFSSLFVLLLGTAKTDSSALGHAVLFRVSAMITSMVLLGKTLESSAKSKAAAGVAELTALQPQSSTLYDPQRNVECHTNAPVNVLTVGDVVSIGPSDKIPTDGIVVDGYSAVNESMLTGESTDVAKSKGDRVYGGTINQQGALLVRTTAVGDESFVSQVVNMVNDAQTAHAPIEALADRISAWFVPVVVFLSCAVFTVWYVTAITGAIPKEWYAQEGKFFFALLFMLETMVIACPCALGLATPTAVMVGSSVGASLGVLFRNGAQAIEAANHVRTVVFDKTGTLTIGKPNVSTSFVSEPSTQHDFHAEALLSELVLLVESKSKHPLASAICKRIQSVDLQSATPSRGPFKLSSVQETPGRGIEAVVNHGEYHVCIGSASFVFDKVVPSNVFTETELARIEAMQAVQALTVVVACVNGSLACVYGLSDPVRPEAAAVVRELHSLGFRTAMVTGDSSGCGEVVARRVGIPIDNVHTGILPIEKKDIMKEYPGPCFVGDGVNDAVAIAGADLGVAIGAGSPVAAESADIVLVRSDLWSAVDALHLSKATLRRINLNFIWAVAYNVVCIPLAAGVLYPVFKWRVPPMIASLAMAMSSTSVIVSSMALRLYRPRARPEPASEDEPSDSSSPRSGHSDEGYAERLGRPLLQADV